MTVPFMLAMPTPTPNPACTRSAIVTSAEIDFLKSFS
jgi:hypothetical protein